MGVGLLRLVQLKNKKVRARACCRRRRRRPRGATASAHVTPFKSSPSEDLPPLFRCVDRFHPGVAMRTFLGSRWATSVERLE